MPVTKPALRSLRGSGECTRAAADARRGGCDGSVDAQWSREYSDSPTGHEVEAVEHAREFLKVAPFDPRYGDAELAPAKDKITELLKKVGQIEVQAPPEARLAVDGRDLTEFPKEPVPVTPGQHTVTATINGKVKTVTITPAAGQQVKAVFDFGTEANAEGLAQPSNADAKGERSTLGWVVPIGLGIVGLGGIAMGAGFASAANSTKDEVDRQAKTGPCAQTGAASCGAHDDKISTGNSQIMLSWVGYAVGGAALVASVVTFVVWPKSRAASPKTGGMTLVPIVDAHRAGATLQLRF